jgi:LPS export ABC transporter protein LptC
MRVFLAAAAFGLAACGGSAGPAPQEPHQILEEFTMRQEELGNPVWSLVAHSAILKEDQKMAVLAEPRMEFFKKKKVVTRLSAAGGEIGTDNADLRLSPSVVVASLEDQSTVRTELLQYSSTRKMFFTDKEVVVSRPGGVLHGKGLEATPDLSEIRIFQQTSVVDKTPSQ